MSWRGFTCSKNALTALNVLYILVAIVLIGVAAYAQGVAMITGIKIMSGLITCGVLLLLIAIIGILGAVKHHQVMLFFYMIILFLLFLIQFAVACTCLALNSDQQHTLLEKSWKTIPDSLKNNAENRFECCGFEDQNIVYQDAQSESYEPLGHQPCIVAHLKCCANSEAYCCTGTRTVNSTVLASGSTTPGSTTPNPDQCPCASCWEGYFEPHLGQAIAITGGIGLFFSFTEIIGVCLTVRYRNQKDPRANPSAFL